MSLLDLIHDLLRRNADNVAKKAACTDCVTHRGATMRHVFDPIAQHPDGTRPSGSSEPAIDPDVVSPNTPK